jgi:hypothetical protein
MLCVIVLGFFYYDKFCNAFKKKKIILLFYYGQPLEFRPHLYFVDFMSHALFYIMTSLPAFIKVGKTPATQNLVLEQCGQNR